MNIEDAQEDADAGDRFAVDHDGGNIRDFPVGGRDNGARCVGNHPLRVPKEPKEEGSQQEARYGPDWSCEPANEQSCQQQKESIVVAVAHHGS